MHRVKTYSEYLETIEMSNARAARSKTSHYNQKREVIQVTVLRLGHRLVRDTRMSTHAALVSRALGARAIIMCGAEEDDTIDSVRRVNERWGGDFQISHSNSWREAIRDWKGLKVHLTMYGEPIDRAIPKIKQRLKKMKAKEILLIIGAEKVPKEVYSMVDYNVAVGSQPHSEVAALALFLDRIYEGKELQSHDLLPKKSLNVYERRKLMYERLNNINEKTPRTKKNEDAFSLANFWSSVGG